MVGAGELNMSSAKVLSKDSITSVINIFSTETSGKAITLSLDATNNGSNSTEWQMLVATKTNWTINLS